MKRALGLIAIVALAWGLRLQLGPADPRVVRGQALDATASAVARGAAVYVKYGCATCHGAEGKGGFANPNAETDGKVPGVTLVGEGYTRAELRKKILDGFATIGKKDPQGSRPPYRMPGWSGQMSDQEVADLVEFLWSLLPKGAGDKWR